MPQPRPHGDITEVETIAEGNGIRDLARLRDTYPTGKNWTKKKGCASVILEDGSVVRAELHWYQAHGLGKVEMKIKRFL